MDHDDGAARLPQVLEAMATTRAIRRYRLDEPIPEADLAAMLFAATRAPTGSNRQTFRFVVLRDGGPAREAKGILGEGFRRAWQTVRLGRSTSTVKTLCRPRRSSICTDQIEVWRQAQRSA